MHTNTSNGIGSVHHQIHSNHWFVLETDSVKQEIATSFLGIRKGPGETRRGGNDLLNMLVIGDTWH